MDQLRHNDIEQIMLGDYPHAVQNAVIESMGAFEKHSVAYLSKDVSRLANRFILDVLLKGLGRWHPARRTGVN